ncbi:hypothetical protein B8X02_00430 [Stenotrophomonas rhizophila]|jgi:hypothetical protein|uniref:Uncharacterized protein n=1 Tax=Stenotrophomonas rhizophila TaxID=216778 RepID=A0AAP5AMT8_9GAMM|nr:MULTISPECIES: hypothetical protein [Stenotrophomonas]MDQ1064475.1 hypothetical protein [Stenotrophomonas sp. SORGH_AS_0282]MDQ1110470.1 hypothetical protein [Stenotrophomonas rhizophila]MDQ1190890.1 hypothetical protein [Stenotrophomonas sp. SORGH_AS_0282]MDY0980510.1 hypothetical protein [Stenotrophomonas sp. CFBP8994]PAK94354.1 hypothetical protein B8X02_00430 [Stenotrophomonas rhizophila]
MSALSTAKTVVLSVLCVVVALFVLGMVSGAGGWIAPWLGLGEGEVRLAWDLGWTILGGIAATAFAARYAPMWPYAHGGVVWVLIAAASVFAAWDLGSDYPFWFVVTLLVSLPVQAIGIWLGARYRTR